MKYYLINATIYTLTYIVPLLLYLLEKEKNSQYLHICLVSQLYFQMLEILQMVYFKRDYFADYWNLVDQLSFGVFMFFYIQSIVYRNNKYQDNDIVIVILVFIMLFRLQFFMRIFENTGQLTELVVQCFKDLVPFLFLLILWNSFFAVEYYLLGCNE